MLRSTKEFLQNIIYYYNEVLKSKDTFKIGLLKSLRMKLMGFTPDQYTLFSLDKNDPKLYITEIERWKTRRVNGVYTVALDNKLLFYDLFKDDINLSPNILRIDDNVILDEDAKVLSEAEIETLLKKHEVVYFKPIYGGGGAGIFRVMFSEGWYLNKDKITFKDLYMVLKKSKNYVANPSFFQKGFSHDIFPETTNTIRLVTGYHEQTASVEVLFAIHRFGTKETIPVDNVSIGGLFSAIDIYSGELSGAKNYKNESFEVHPDSSVQIKGKVVPMWEEIKTYFCEKALKYSYIPYMSWDIVLCENSFSVIEINASTGLTWIQMWGPQRNTKLGKFLKEKGAIK